MLKSLLIELKRDFYMVVSREICKFLRTPFLTEQLQWLLLRFNSFFQRNPEQKAHATVEGLLPPTVIKPTLFRNSASKVAGLQVHATTPGKSRNNHSRYSLKEGLQLY